MPKIRIVLVFLAGLGCARNATLPTTEEGPRSSPYLIQLDHKPTRDDSVETAALGGSDILPIPLANGILVRAANNGFQFKTIPGCQYVIYLDTYDPRVMVVLAFRDRITAGELATVSSLSSGAPVVDTTGTVLTAWLVLKTINQLQGDTNLLAARVDPHLYFPK